MTPFIYFDIAYLWTVFYLTKMREEYYPLSICINDLFLILYKCKHNKGGHL